VRIVVSNSDHLKDNVKIITQINLNKMMESRTNSQSQEIFQVGDRVRKRVKVIIKNRSYNPNYSTEIFTIERINGNKIYLNGLIKPVVADELQLIPKDSIEGNDVELNKAIKADKRRRALIKEGIETKNKDNEPIQIQRAKRDEKMLIIQNFFVF